MFLNSLTEQFAQLSEEQEDEYDVIWRSSPITERIQRMNNLGAIPCELRVSPIGQKTVAMTKEDVDSIASVLGKVNKTNNNKLCYNNYIFIIYLQINSILYTIAIFYSSRHLVH